MNKKPADFNVAFARLTTELSKQANGNQIISFDRATQEPFEATYAPNSSHALHELGRVFSGDDNRSLFLRLDGPAIYLIVATVLQFPPCSMLSKIVFFFTDVLKLYIDGSEIHDTLGTLLGESFTRGELAKRQKTIFSQLIPRLKALLFDDDKHDKVRRLIAQLIMGLCQKNAQGWRVLMEAQAQLLFGNLFSRVHDYVLRILISDILRHLLANNFEVHELWSQSSEDVMGFPASQELDTATVSSILHYMSALDAATAFREERHSQLYRVSDVKISGLQYHSARCDTIVVVDDHLTLLVPNGGLNGAFFAAYEFAITHRMYLENHQTTENQTSYVRICWKEGQGYVVLRGRKERVGDIRLQFQRHDTQKEFCDAFDNAFERQAQNAWSSQPQQHRESTQRMQSIVVNYLAKPDADRDSKPRPRAADCRTKSLAKDIPLSVGHDSLTQMSSDSIVKDLAMPSDVFAFADDNVSSMRSTELSQKLSQAKTIGVKAPSSDTPFGSREGEEAEVEAHSSPLSKYGRCMEGSEAIIPSRMPARNPSLSGALDQEKDAEFAGFLMTASRANAAHRTFSKNRPIHLGQLQQAASQDQSPNTFRNNPPYTKSNDIQHGSRPAVVNYASSKRSMEPDEAPVATKKRLKTTSSDINDKMPKVTLEDLEVLEVAVASTEKPKVPLKAASSRSRKSLLPIGSKSAISNSVDWDEDLRTNRAEMKRPNTENKLNMKPLPRRPLIDTTNTIQRPRAAAQNQTSKTRKTTARSRRVLPARSASPVRRSQRTATSEARSYAESLTSEDADRQEDHPRKRISRRARPSNSRSSKDLDPQKKTKAKKTKIGLPSARYPPESRIAANTAHQGERTETFIVVPSSDDEDESESAGLAKSLSRQSKQARDVNAPSADEEDEVPSDSYPYEGSGPRPPPRDSDRSFGNKLSDLIATSAVMPDGDNMQRAVSTPFGNPKHLIRNVNAAKEIFSPVKKTSPSIPLQLAASASHSEVTDTQGTHKAQKELLEHTEAEQDMTAHDKVVSDTACQQDSFQSTGNLHCASETSAEQDRIDKSKSVNASEQDHTVRAVEEQETEDRENAPPVHGDVKTNAQQPLQSLGMLEKQGRSPPEADRISTKISSPGKGKNTEALNLSWSAGRLQHKHNNGSKTPQSLASRSGSLKSVKQSSATPSRLRSAAGSSRTHIVHFGNGGPSLLEQRLPNQGILRQRPQDEQDTQISKTTSRHEGHKKHTASKSVSSLVDCRPFSKNTVLQHTNVNDNDALPTRADLSYQQAHFADNDDFYGVADDGDLVRASEEPVAPSNLETNVAESDNVNRRSNPDTELHHMSSVVQPATNHRATTTPSSTSHADEQSIQSASWGNTQIVTGCNSSADIAVAIPENPESADSGNLPDTSEARNLTHESAVASINRPNSCENLTDITAFPKPASLSTTQQEIKSGLAASQADIQISKDRNPAFSVASIPQIGSSKQPGTAFHGEHTPLFSISTIARNIFSNKNKPEPASTSIPAKSSDQFEVSDEPVNSKAVTRPAESDIAMSKSPFTRDREQARLVTHESPLNVPFRNHHERAMDRPTGSPVLHAQSTSADRQPQAAHASDETLNIIRVNRKDPSPARDSSMLAFASGTPQAFLQRLHDPTSPIIGAQSFLDAIETPDIPREHSQPVRKERFDQNRLHLQKSIPFSVYISKQQAPSSVTSSEADEDQSMLPQAQHPQTRTGRSTAIFASMVEGSMLKVMSNLVDRINAEETVIAEQIEAYHIGSMDLVENLRRNSFARINHDASKVRSALREQQQDMMKAKAQLAKITRSRARSDQASQHIEQHNQRMHAMLDKIRP